MKIDTPLFQKEKKNPLFIKFLEVIMIYTHTHTFIRGLCYPALSEVRHERDTSDGQTWKAIREGRLTVAGWSLSKKTTDVSEENIKYC